MKKLVLAYSGGLDTSYCIKKLTEQGYDIYAVSINTGGFSNKDLKKIKSNALSLGCKYYKSINSIKNFYDKIIKYLIFGNVLKNNTYPLSVSSERIIQAIEIVNYAKSINAKYIAHGSTGAGNDQIRFDMIFQILAPNIEIITPIRDEKVSRKDEIKYLKSHGIKIPWEKAQYSINRGLWGTSIGGSETLTSNKNLPEKAYPSKLSKNKLKKISIEFKYGELIALNGKNDNPTKIIDKLQNISPSNIQIYIKEHPQEEQNDPMARANFWNSISKKNNIFVLPSDLKTSDILNNFDIIATVDGSVGWEAIKNLKPVICFGKPWYLNMPGAFEPNKISNYEEILKVKWTLEDINQTFTNLTQKMGIGYVVHIERKNGYLDSIDEFTNNKALTEEQKKDFFLNNDKRVAESFYKIYSNTC